MSAIYNIEVEEKTDYTLPIDYNTDTRTNYTPVDITGYTAKFQVKPSGLGTTVVLTVGSGITIPNPTDGIFLIDVETAAGRYDFQFGNYEFEIINPSGKIARKIKGSFTLKKELVP